MIAINVTKNIAQVNDILVACEVPYLVRAMQLEEFIINSGGKLVDKERNISFAPDMAFVFSDKSRILVSKQNGVQAFSPESLDL